MTESASTTTPLPNGPVRLDPPATHTVARIMGVPWISGGVLALTAIAMLIWTWGTWCDPLTDFGREIYIAWRLSAGEVLYRDIDYFNGPVSPYINSLVFRVLSPSLLTLVFSNLLWWSALTAMLYRLVCVIADRLCAFVATFLFIALFSFIQLFPLANFNFLTPYSNEVTHSLTCAFAALMLLNAYLRNGNAWKLAGSGFFIGLMFLMKVEITAAIVPAIITGTALNLWSRRAKALHWTRPALVLIVSALIAPLAAFSLLRMAMPAADALRGILGSWRFVADPRISNNPMYKLVNGTDHPAQSMVAALLTFCAYTALLAPAALIAMLSRDRTSLKQRILAGVLASGSIAAALAISWKSPNWSGALRGLNLVLLGMATAWVITLVRRRREDITARLILQGVFCLFALLMLGKVFLHVVVFHYGFALAAPGFAVAVILLLRWLPNFIADHGGSPCVFRCAALTLLAIVLAKHLMVYGTIYRPRLTEMLGLGADQFATDARGRPLNAMLDVLSVTARKRATLAMVPEGAMINFLVHRSNPTGELTLLPGELLMFGDRHVLDRFRDHPPDWIMMVPCDTSIFGYKGFGIDYGEALAGWIRANYRDMTPKRAFDARYPIYLMKYDPEMATTKPVAASGD